MGVTIEILQEILNDDTASSELKAIIRQFLDSFGGDVQPQNEIEDFAEVLFTQYYAMLPPELMAQIQPAAGEEKFSQGRFQDALYLGVPPVDLATGEQESADPTQQSFLDIFEEGDLFAGFEEQEGPADNSGSANVNSRQEQIDPALFTETSGAGSQGTPDFAYEAVAESRNIDGTGNNLLQTNWGSTGQTLLSFSGFAYDDGYSAPREDGLPSAREISNALFAQAGDIFSGHEYSNLLWIWGQFIDHDITLTREGHGEAYNITVPMGDPYFDPFWTGTQSISLTRSGYAEGTGTETGNPRLQVNEITAFIDASMVYGSDEITQALLRGEGGKLALGAGDLLPLTMGAHGPEFFAGDVRVNENVALTSMHTLFVREHNYWVDVLAKANPTLTDEELYQTAKAIVEAEIQHITFEEFLPALVGADAFSAYQGYNENIDPQMAREFSTAAFRVGHTMLSSDIFRLQEDGAESDLGHLTLRDAFFRPDKVMIGGIDEILRGVAGSYAQEVDCFVIDDVRNFLFGPPGAGGFDLVALNIQRGRDHGLPGYNDVREAYGLERIEDFSAFTDDPALVAKLTTLYGSPDNMDLWVGGLLEEAYGGGIVGETFHAIIVDQFTRLRDGDRFWYEGRLDDFLMDEIAGTTLSDIILRNTDIEYLQDDALQMTRRIGGNDASNHLQGAEGADLLIGFDGDDVLEGFAGADTLYGGAGADIFLYEVATALSGGDIIRDFNAQEGDLLNISDLLQNYDPLSQVISDFVQTSNSAAGIKVQVDLDGSAGLYGWQDVVLLENVHDFSLENALSSFV